jgi:GntR family transcriptional regulator
VLIINPESGTPIYLQIMEQIRHAIGLGVFPPGTSIPTIRELALQLHVNPNTVAKAIRELEREGLLITRVGKGSFVSESALALSAQDREQQGNELAGRFGKDMVWLGFNCPETVSMVEKNWTEVEKKDVK